MGKCISKNPTSLTIALSEKDLARASRILCKFSGSCEHVALKGEQSEGDDIVVISSAGAGHRTGQPQQEQRLPQQSLQRQQNCKDVLIQENTCSHSLDHWTDTKCTQRQQIINNDDKSNDALDDVHHITNNNTSNTSNSNSGINTNNKGHNDYGDVVESMPVYSGHIHDECDSKESVQDEDKYITIIKCSSSCCDENGNNNSRGSKENTIYADINFANCNNNRNSSNIKKCIANGNDYNYCAEIPAYLTQFLLYQQHKKPLEQSHSVENSASSSVAVIDYCNRDGPPHKVERQWENASPPDDGAIETLDTELQGQAESKKNSKKQTAGEIHTKGTAMSFGFRKNLNTTPKKLKKLIKGEVGKHSKKQDKCNANDTEGADKAGSGFVDTGLDTGNGGNETDTVIDANNTKYTKSCTDKLVCRDDNGNADFLDNVHFEKMGAAAAATIQTSQNTAIGRAGSNVKLPGAGSRFGFRGSYRPSSTDITSRQQRQAEDNFENNNYATNGSSTKGVLVSNLKRRSKSAHAGRTTSSSNESDTETGTTSRNTQTKTITFNLKQNSTIEYDRRQFFEQPALGTQPATTTTTATTGNIYARASQFHNNVIVRPTPRVAATSMATAYSKFTLQTVSLPKPEFAVAISINATTPTTPANNSYVTSPALGVGVGVRSSGRHSLAVAQPSSALGGQRMDAKQAKHMTNSTRRSFSGSREISADSGIASLDMALDSSTSSGAVSLKRTASPKRSRSRPRNLQMVMNGRHRFEVKDLDDSLSSESSSIVEPLALPKLPAEHQTVLLPLSGLVRSNTVLSRESYELRNSVAKHKENASAGETKPQHQAITNLISRQPSEEDSESVEEEKLHLDRSATEKASKDRHFKEINTCSSKTSSPCSSVISSWCNAGESLAANDFSNLSISSSEDSNKHDNKIEDNRKANESKLSFELNDDDLITLNTDVPISTISSFSEPVALKLSDEIDSSAKFAMFEKERPKSIGSSLNETKFAEMALEGSTFLLDDETSPTDSLVSSTGSEEAVCKQTKHKMNEELQEKDIDEISPELDLASPSSPGTPTHASHSLSLSDCGNLIDDEIADQPALLFNQESQDGGAESGASRRDKTDTPTLMESMGSMRASINKSRSALHQAMELSLRTPLSLRKAVMERAESLDTLSPCESICSDDLMMDFDVASSMDSIDRSASIKSRSGSDLNHMDDTEMFPEFNRKGSQVMKELSSILRTRTQKTNDKDVSAHLPARATRLLNRSRMQQHCTLNNDDSDSARSPLTTRRRTNTASSRTSTPSSTTNNNNNSSSNNHTNNSANSTLQRKFPNQNIHNHHHHHHHHHQASSSFHQRDTHSSSDDLMLYDKSFRNAMIQDVLQFKKQLLRLRKILQETETLNPFENDNGQLFTSCGLDSKLLDDIDLASLTSSTTDDPIQELADLRRQVVYLQGQVDDRDRTIRLQKNLIEKLEAEKLKAPHVANEMATKECVDTATQTERTRPLTIGTESLSRSKPEYTSYTTYFPAICSDSNTIVQHHQQNPVYLANNQTRRHTIISTTLTNYNQQLSTPRHTPRRASIAWEQQAPSYKPVKITLIGDPLAHWQSEANSLKKNKDEDFNKNCIRANLHRQQQPKTPLAQQENAHNNMILNSKHHHHLQDIMVANEFKTQTHQHTRNSNQHHYNHHNQQLQQQQATHQFYKTSTHQHNNLQPTVTIV